MQPLRMLGPLVLMFLLCADADSTCPAEFNPLAVAPPAVVGEYGASFLVNCTSSEEFHNGMYWKLGNQANALEEDKDFVSALVSLSDWKLKAECRIKTNDTFECSKDLEITVYKTPDDVTVTGSTDDVMEEGRSYSLICHIVHVAPVEKLRVTWRRGNEIIYTKTYDDRTVTPVNVTSNLTITAQRYYNGAFYTCEAELDLGPNNPQVVSLPYTADVHYAPELKNITDDVIFPLFEGEDVSLSCEAEGNPPPVFTWTSDGENKSDNTSTLNISGVHTSENYTCTASNYLGEASKNFIVHVIPEIRPAALEERDCPLTLTPAEVVVRYGNPVSINCSTSAPDLLEMGWEAPIGGTGFEKKPELSWRVEKLESWTLKPQCYVTLNDNYQCFKRPNITLYKTPDTVSLSGLDDPDGLVEGTEHVLLCEITNVAPVQDLRVNWYRDDKLIHTAVFTDNTVTPVKVSPNLTITAHRSDIGALYRCEAELDLGPKGPEITPKVTSPPYTLDVHYAPEFKIIDDENFLLSEGQDVSLSCEAEGNPPPVFTWTSDGENMSHNTSTLNISGVHISEIYTCTASNYLGDASKNFMVHVIPESRPAAPEERDCPLTLTPAEVVVRFGDPVSINCSTSAPDLLGMGWEAPIGGTGFERKPELSWRVEKLESWTLKPQCVAILSDNYQCFKRPNITLYKTPDTVSLSGLDDPDGLVEGTEHVLLCEITNVAPVQDLRVNWYRNDKLIHTAVFTDNTVTPVKVSPNLTITAHRSDIEALYRCEAELDLGPKGPEITPKVTSPPYTPDVHYAPVIKEGNVTKEVNLGGNVTFNCHAEANPSPKIQWQYAHAGNVLEATRGQQRSITITEATSTNAGVYLCVATNRLGNETRSVTLVVKDAFVFPAWVTWVLLILVVISVIIIVFLIAHCHQKKHGQYSFVPDKAKDGSEIPMTAKSNGVCA